MNRRASLGFWYYFNDVCEDLDENCPEENCTFVVLEGVLTIDGVKSNVRMTDSRCDTSLEYRCNEMKKKLIKNAIEGNPGADESRIQFTQSNCKFEELW